MKILTFILLISQLGAILLFWKELPPELPLYYSKPPGKEQLASPLSLFLLPLLSLIIFLVNFSLSYLLNKYFPEQEGKLLTKILKLSAAVFGSLCLITLLKIITLVS